MEYPEGFYSSYHSQKPICGVLATAMAAGVSYDVAHAACKDAMHIVFPKRQRFGGVTYEPQLDLALTRLGVKFEKTVYASQAPRLIDLVATLESGVMYHVITPKHIQTIRDGMLIDQGRLQPVADCIQAKKRVRYIRKIIGKGW